MSDAYWAVAVWILVAVCHLMEWLAGPMSFCPVLSLGWNFGRSLLYRGLS